MFNLTIRGQLYRDHLSILTKPLRIKTEKNSEGVEQFINRKCHSSALFLFGQLTSIYQYQRHKDKIEFARAYAKNLSNNICSGMMYSSRTVNAYMKLFEDAIPNVFTYKRRKNCKAFQFRIRRKNIENQSFILLFEVGEKKRDEQNNIVENKLSSDATTLLILSCLLDKAACTYRNGYGGFWANPHQLDEVRKELNLSFKTFKNHLQTLIEKKVISIEKPTLKNSCIEKEKPQSLYENSYVYFDNTLIDSYMRKVSVNVTEDGKKYLEYHDEQMRLEAEEIERNNNVDVPGYFVKPLPNPYLQPKELTEDDIKNLENKFNNDIKKIFGKSLVDVSKILKQEQPKTEEKHTKLPKEIKHKDTSNLTFSRLDSKTIKLLMASANDITAEDKTEIKTEQSVSEKLNSNNLSECNKTTHKEEINNADNEAINNENEKLISAITAQCNKNIKAYKPSNIPLLNWFYLTPKTVGKNLHTCWNFYDDFLKFPENYCQLVGNKTTPILIKRGHKLETKYEINYPLQERGNVI